MKITIATLDLSLLDLEEVQQRQVNGGVTLAWYLERYRAGDYDLKFTPAQTDADGAQQPAYLDFTVPGCSDCGGRRFILDGKNPDEVFSGY